MSDETTNKKQRRKPGAAGDVAAADTPVCIATAGAAADAAAADTPVCDQPDAPVCGATAGAAADAPFRQLAGTPVVYMLRCRDDSLYTGWTNDFPRRLAAHSSGKGGKYTRSRLPVAPAYIEIVSDRSAALQREAAIKKLPPHKKRELLSSESNILRDGRTVDE